MDSSSLTKSTKPRPPKQGRFNGFISAAEAARLLGFADTRPLFTRPEFRRARIRQKGRWYIPRIVFDDYIAHLAVENPRILSGTTNLCPTADEICGRTENDA